MTAPPNLVPFPWDIAPPATPNHAECLFVKEYQELTPLSRYSHVLLIQESHIFKWADEKKLVDNPSPNFQGL